MRKQRVFGMKHFMRYAIAVVAIIGVFLPINAGTAVDDVPVAGLSIPSLDISVPVSEKGFRAAQEIVDEENAAVLLEYPCQWVIVDHRSQEFFNLPSAVPYETIAYLRSPANEQGFLCTYAEPGRIVENAKGGRVLWDADGLPVAYSNEGGLCMYTCLGYMENGVLDVMITYWQPMD